MAEKSKGRKVDDALLIWLAKLDNQFIEIRNQFTNSKSPRSDFEEVKQAFQWVQERKKVTLAEALQLVIGKRFTPSEDNPFQIVEEVGKNFHLPENFILTPIYDCVDLLEKYYGTLGMLGINKKILDARKRADKLANKYGIDCRRIIPIAVPSLYVASRIEKIAYQLYSEHGLVVERVAVPFLEEKLLGTTDLWLENCCSKKMGYNHLDSIGAYRNFLQGLNDDINIVLLLVDAFQGYSVQACRWELEHHCPQIIPAGSFIISHLLAEMPEIISISNKYFRFGFDAPGDIYDKNGKRNFSESINFEVMETEDEAWLKLDCRDAKDPNPANSSVVILTE